MRRNVQRFISLGLLTSALGLFVAFHFVKGFGSVEAGWTVWRDLMDLFQDPEQMKDTETMVIVFSFLTFCLLILASPFLGAVWQKSRFAWLFVVISSALATAGFWGMVFSDPPETLGSGGTCLMLAPLLNFCGLVLARLPNPKPTIPEIPSTENT